MDDNVIKNPNRTKPQKVNKSTYVPEWQKLGYEPANLSDKSKDFVMYQKQDKLKREKIAYSPVGIAPIQEYAPIQPPKAIKQNMEYDEDLPSLYMEEESSRPISWEETPSPPVNEDVIDDSDTSTSDDVENQNSLENIKDGFYSIFIKETLIFSSESLSEIKKAIESMITNSELDITVEDIMVFKKLSLKVGVLVTE